MSCLARANVGAHFGASAVQLLHSQHHIILRILVLVPVIRIVTFMDVGFVEFSVLVLFVWKLWHSR